MAGYILKIMIEDTHPPVWRRVIIPEMITFAELHEIIQILFGWSGSHLHDFSIPSKNVCIDDGEEPWARYHYLEEETLVEQFLLNNKWIRYTYDFGDEWRHKIIYENTEEGYEKRYPFLLKVKGDNFLEDSGGLWGGSEDGSNRCRFDQPRVKKCLEKFICPVHDDLTEKIEEGIGEADLDKMAEYFIQKLCDEFTKRFPKDFDSKTQSVMAKKINKWREFLENDDNATVKAEDSTYEQMTLPFIEPESWENAGNMLQIAVGEKTQRQLLGDLGLQEAKDYCKYLQIPAENSWTKKQMTDAVAETFYEHPEYLLYVLDEEEYQEFLRWTKFPCGIVRERPEQNNALIKAVSLGLADITVQKKKAGSRAILSFAKDLRSILSPLKAELKKKTYRELDKFSSKLGNMILAYGFADLDCLFEMFGRIYHDSMGRETFFRYVYWHARFNEMVQTAYSLDGRNYVCALQIDMEAILKKTKKYADDLDYVMFSAAELKKMSESIANRSYWTEILVRTMRFQLGLSNEQAAMCMEDMFISIMNGDALTEVLKQAYGMCQKETSLMGMCELWESTVGVMLELELPMLKGRSRNQYAEEKGISAWQVGMLEDAGDGKDSKKKHMSEFPMEIQETMYQACCFGSREDMEMLLQYQAKEKIMSEEFLCILAQAHITCCEFDKGEKLIRKLENSSQRGKKAANALNERLQDGWDAMDDEDFAEFSPWYFQETDSQPVLQPYVRETPKIGRNDPCPCGSGKKYKKCCGRNR